MASQTSSINAHSREATENQNDKYPDIQCPCLIPNTKGVHQCTMMFKSKFGTSPLRLDQFMKHYVSKAHQGAQVPNEVKKWFPHGCPTPAIHNNRKTTTRPHSTVRPHTQHSSNTTTNKKFRMGTDRQ